MLMAYSVGMSTYRIPPSLSWLIHNRRVVLGRKDIASEAKNKLESKYKDAKNIIQEYEVLSQQIAELEKDLEAIDRSIGLHEVPIDISQIAKLRPHKKPSLFKHGVLVQSIYMVLSKEPTKWLSTTEIAVTVKVITNFDDAGTEFVKLRHVVRNRLIGLAFEGKIDRVNTGQLNKEGFWRQKPSHRTGITYSEVPPEVDYLANNPEKT